MRADSCVHVVNPDAATAPRPPNPRSIHAIHVFQITENTHLKQAADNPQQIGKFKQKTAYFWPVLVTKPSLRAVKLFVLTTDVRDHISHVLTSAGVKEYGC
jgi:hypothetical protein